jgi:hypothetical protein
MNPGRYGTGMPITYWLPVVVVVVLWLVTVWAVEQPPQWCTTPEKTPRR